MYTLIKSLGKGFVDLIFPPLCIHCDAMLEQDLPLFCKDCLNLLEMIDPSMRCPGCFSADFLADSEQYCGQCLKNKRYIHQIASVFDYEGPITSLVKQIKYGNQPELSRGAGAYMAAQFINLQWPLPDYIVPMPIPKLRRIERGYNQSALLAQSIATLLGCPYLEAMQRHEGDFSQAGLNYEQRLTLKSDRFYVKPGLKLYDKTILLIDDVMTTGTTLQCCGEAFQEAFPDQLFALTLCRAF